MDDFYSMYLKSFLFDHGITIPKNQQTNTLLSSLTLDLIENQGVEVPNYLKNWYQRNRTFSIQQTYGDILNEITKQMNLEDLEQFCKTNTQYKQYCHTLLSNKLTEFKLLEKPKTYEDWVIKYHKSKQAYEKAEFVLYLLKQEDKDLSTYNPEIYLFYGTQNTEQFKLLPYYKPNKKNKIAREEGAFGKNYDTFSISLSIDENEESEESEQSKILWYHFHHLHDPDLQVGFKGDQLDILYRYFYFYPGEHPKTWNNIFILKEDLIEQLPTLTDDEKNIALYRLKLYNELK